MPKARVLVINLDQDQDRLADFMASWHGHEVIRVPGVKHRDGRTGCRLAHLRASREARIHWPCLICEDDARLKQPLGDLCPPLDARTLFVGCQLYSKSNVVRYEDGGWTYVGSGWWGPHAYTFDSIATLDLWVSALERAPSRRHFDTYLRGVGWGGCEATRAYRMKPSPVKHDRRYASRSEDWR